MPSLRRARRGSRAFLAAVLLAGAALAGEAPPLADDPALEARVSRLATELRCLVCQNQTIADSHADLALDLKKQVREKLRAGWSDRQVLDFMVERYGDFVLYRPPVRATTVLLWAGPFVLLAGAGIAAVLHVRRRPVAKATDEREDDDALREAERLLAGREPGS